MRGSRLFSGKRRRRSTFLEINVSTFYNFAPKKDL